MVVRGPGERDALPEAEEQVERVTDRVWAAPVCGSLAVVGAVQGSPAAPRACVASVYVILDELDIPGRTHGEVAVNSERSVAFRATSR